MFQNDLVRLPSDKVENMIHRKRLQIKESTKEPRVFVGHYQPEDIVCVVDSDGVIKFKRICKEGMTRHRHPINSKD